jgi:hypothetical protein
MNWSGPCRSGEERSASERKWVLPQSQRCEARPACTREGRDNGKIAVETVGRRMTREFTLDFRGRFNETVIGFPS